MMAGGIYDQLGGGFARYSVDAAWLVPHFEKMLYDNALLARAYLHGWQASGTSATARVCEETLDWVLREMRGPEGGFYSRARRRLRGRGGPLLRLDAGRDPRRSLGDADAAAGDRRFYGVTERGNFEGAQHPPPRRRRDAPSRTASREARRALLRGARAAGPARPRRQAPRPPGTR